MTLHKLFYFATWSIVGFKSMISNRLLSVAPMMERTDRHCRYFFRLLSKETLLYSEMISADAIIRGDKKKLLDFSNQEHPIALQVGGSDPKILAEATKIGIDWGYDEINLNVGCPSSKVSSGEFGACLMKNIDLVAKCVEAMKKNALEIPVTIKCRIGVDDQDPKVVLPKFIQIVSQAGISIFVIHARKAILNGLSPKENRKIPPINYDLVDNVRNRFSNLQICINGEIRKLETVSSFIDQGFAGCMIGRQAYKNPKILLNADAKIFKSVQNQQQECEGVRLRNALINMLAYLEWNLSIGGKASNVLRHLINSVSGMPGAKNFRSIISKGMTIKTSGPELLSNAMNYVDFGEEVKGNIGL